MASTKAENPDEPVLPEKEPFSAFFFNRKEGTVLGRTAKSWAKIGLFYCIYYGCLAGWFAGLLHAFYSTLDDVKPTYYGANSLTLSNPGVGVRPMPVGDLTLIRFSAGIPSSYYPYTEHLKMFFQTYNSTLTEGATDTEGAMPCEDDDTNNSTRACLVDVESILAEAGCGRDFGYYEGEPCVLVKMNKLIGFTPEPYADRAAVEAAVEEQKEIEKDNRHKLYKDDMPRYLSIADDGTSVGVSCEGHNSIDRGNIEDVTYAPMDGLNKKYFPYMNQEGYRSPFVIFKFKVSRREVVQITCKAWAKNIDNSDGQQKRGSAHFELLID